VSELYKQFSSAITLKMDPEVADDWQRHVELARETDRMLLAYSHHAFVHVGFGITRQFAKPDPEGCYWCSLRFQLYRFFREVAWGMECPICEVPRWVCKRQHEEDDDGD
jgi:hypothetical protein